MKSYWTRTRPNGKPVEDGLLCRVTDAEDGTPPIYTYGATEEEILEKQERQNLNAQAALARAKRKPIVFDNEHPAELPTAREFTADDVMRATADLDNPAKAPAAVATLLEAATGVDPKKAALREFARLGLEWEKEHPEFWPHPGNRDLLARQSVYLAGGSAAAVTKDHITRAFQELTARGILFEREETPAHDPNSNPSSPGETLEPARGQSATRFSTGSTGLRGPAQPLRPPAPAFRPQYTKDQIDKMPIQKARDLIERGDRGYLEACEFYYGERAKATA